MENFSLYYLGFDIIGTIPGDFIVNESYPLDLNINKNVDLVPTMHF
jgi:hypothetical protein